MAPRPLESKAAFLERLSRAVAEGREELRFGTSHFTHAVCHEGDSWRVRRLELDRARASEYLETHGTFMPEHAEMLSTPGAAVLEASSLSTLVAMIDGHEWPFPT